jgi:HEAT repeat protein
MARRPDRTEVWLDRLRELDGTPERAGAVLAEALARGSGPVIARAAPRVGLERRFELEPALLAAWRRLDADGLKRDKGCAGRLALAEALDRLDHLDPAPFLRGSRTRQYEPVWGGREETAGALRAQCAAALVRMSWPDALSVLAELLADESPEARRGAVAVLASHGGPGALALLRLKHRQGDPDADVAGAVLGAMLAIDTPASLPVVEELLRDEGPPRAAAGPPLGPGALRELALFALGESRQPTAVPLLLDALDRAVLPRDRAAVLTALAVHRSAPARDALLGCIRDGDTALAKAAVRALQPFGYDGELVAAARAAAAGNADADLSALVDDLLGGR